VAQDRVADLERENERLRAEVERLRTGRSGLELAGDLETTR